MSRVLSPYVLGSEVVRRQRTYTKEDFLKTKLLFRILFLVAFMSILSLFYIWSRVQVVQYGYDLNRLSYEEQKLEEENKKLILEIAMLKSPQRLSQIALDQLKMQAPKPEQIRVLPSP